MQRTPRKRPCFKPGVSGAGSLYGSLGVNSDCMQKIGILLIIVVPVVLLVWWTGGFGVSRTVRSPFMAELNQVKQISVALSYYAEEHSNDVAGKSIEAFIA